METIFVFTQSDSLTKHWNNIIPKKFKFFEIDDLDVFIKNIEIDSGDKLLMMLDITSIDNLTDVLNALKNYPNVKSMLFTNRINLNDAVATLQYGITGYENSYLSSVTFENMLESILEGNKWLNNDITSFLISTYVKSNEDLDKNNVDVTIFTKKEIEILKNISDGLSNAEVASNLNITLSTVKSHIKNIFEKTGISNRVSLALTYKGYV